MPAASTLRSLAAEAGVSPMTVSLALRNSSEISAALRERLQRLAAARGYRPDPHVAKLMHHLRTRAPARATANICGLTLNWPRGTSVGPYGERLLAGLMERAESLGFSFGTLRLDDYPTRSALQRVLVSRGVEGILVLPLREPCDLSDRLDWSAFSVVSATSSLVGPDFHTVMPSHFSNMLHACQQLTQAGFRRIGLAISRIWDERVQHRWAGGIAWHNQFGGTEPVLPLIQEGPRAELDPATLARWISREWPDAVIVDPLDSTLIERVVATLPVKSCPAMVAMNLPNPAADCGIDQRVERIGAVAIETLAAMITRGERGIPELCNAVMVAGQWVPGMPREAPPAQPRKTQKRR